MAITGIDHVSSSLRVTAHMDATMSFYRALGFAVLHEDEYRSGTLDKCAITVGEHKFNMRGAEGHGVRPHVGWVWEGGIDALVEQLGESGVPIHRGPLPVTGGRDGGTRRCIAVVVTDPDGAPVTLVSYEPEDLARYDGVTHEEAYRERARSSTGPVAVNEREHA
ncbi:hypothetical protein GCM10009836_02120 [Pseudonocardia ailaonensis]|uniref:VOC domain-containing protein n=1 Tax=Pseudonocardia ailaonensis TaxID=367279 RepID=A0ABN2MI23_9PSEU